MDPISRILIVGAGQLGSRHLQALAKMTESLSFEVVDPNLVNQKIALERFNEIVGSAKHKINFRLDLPKSGKYDLCVIATNSDVRFECYKSLTESIICEYYLLEKVLFQDVHHYALDSSNRSTVSTFVNCPRRIFKLYNWIKDQDLGKLISMSVKGSSWGFGSNLIHFIDLASYFADSIIYEVTHLQISNQRISKRENFIEFDGSGKFVFENEITLFVTSSDCDQQPLVVEFEYESVDIRVFEGTGEINIYKKGFHECDTTKIFTIPFQSELTNELFSDLKKNGKCNLTPLSEAITLHLPMISSFLKVLKIEGSLCPVT